MVTTEPLKITKLPSLSLTEKDYAEQINTKVIIDDKEIPIYLILKNSLSE